MITRASAVVHAAGRCPRDWVASQPSFKAKRRMSGKHSIEEVGERLRTMMPWIAQNKLVDKEKN